jgi:hypothetical protein
MMLRIMRRALNFVKSSAKNLALISATYCPILNTTRSSLNISAQKICHFAAGLEFAL